LKIISIYFASKPGKFGTQVTRGLIGLGSIYGIILSLTIVGLAVWSFRHPGASVIEEVIQLGGYVSVVWALICVRGLNRSAGDLGAQVPPTSYTGPGPKTQMSYVFQPRVAALPSHFILNVSCMAIFGLLIWLRNE
jgi:hypothetical protein